MKILVLPKDGNPYQELLYTPLRKQGVVADYLSRPTPSHTLNLALLPLHLLYKRLQGYDVVHIHWMYMFGLPWSGSKAKRIAQSYQAMCLWLIKKYGYTLVWTAHNTLPHTPIFADDLEARRTLGKRADLIITHSTATIEALSDMGVAPKGKMTVISHGNYAGIYPDTLTRGQAREKLGLSEDAFVALFFGKIEGYKNVPELLGAAKELAANYPGLHVVVAGSCRDKKLAKRIETEAHDLGANVQLHLGFVADDEIQTFLRAADVMALPFSEVTTSSSAILGLTFGLPVIAPRLGALADFPAEAGFFYDPTDKEGLVNALVAAMRQPTLKPWQSAAKAYAESLSWHKTAKRTIGRIAAARS